jgi:hypothetical protein
MQFPLYIRAPTSATGAPASRGGGAVLVPAEHPARSIATVIIEGQEATLDLGKNTVS